MSITPSVAAQEDYQSIYTPIFEYQIRLIALHGDIGDRKTHLECSLHVVDLLRADFGHGLGLRDLPDKENRRLVKYEALSYAWGTGEPDHLIRCQGVDIPIMANLHEALLTLRRDGETTRWLWVDAVCINQKDSLDKAIQIPNMMFIYQQASRVIAWLDELVDPDVLFHAAAAGSSNFKRLEDAPMAGILAYDVDTVVRALLDIYDKPYFQRVWVQQEIFATRNLVFRSRQSACKLTWSGVISHPISLLTTHIVSRHPELLSLAKDKVRELNTQQGVSSVAINHVLAHSRPVERSSTRWFKSRKLKEPPPEIGGDVIRKLQVVSRVLDHFEERFRCFRAVRSLALKRAPLEIIDALLFTGGLQVTDPRDRIYGLLSMTKFPSKEMTLTEWARGPTDRPSIIPVSYSTSARVLQIVLSRILLCEGGLGILGKFGIAVEEDCIGSRVENNMTSSDQCSNHSHLPSWVVNWQLVSGAFSSAPIVPMRVDPDYQKYQPQALRQLHDAQRYYRAGLRNYRDPRYHLTSGVGLNGPDKEQVDFYRDNSLAATRGVNVSRALEKLIVRGCVEKCFSLHDRAVFPSTSSKGPSDFTKGKAALQLSFSAQRNDILVLPEAFGKRRSGPGFLDTEDVHGGLWLLRRTRTGF